MGWLDHTAATSTSAWALTEALVSTTGFDGVLVAVEHPDRARMAATASDAVAAMILNILLLSLPLRFNGWHGHYRCTQHEFAGVPV